MESNIGNSILASIAVLIFYYFAIYLIAKLGLIILVFLSIIFMLCLMMDFIILYHP